MIGRFALLGGLLTLASLEGAMPLLVDGARRPRRPLRGHAQAQEAAP